MTRLLLNASITFAVIRYASEIDGVPIQSFRDADTEGLYLTARNKRWASIAKVAFRKLDMLHAAAALNDLRSPPGNRRRRCVAIVPGSTAFGPMTSGGSGSAGLTSARQTLRSPTTTERS